MTISGICFAYLDVGLVIIFLYIYKYLNITVLVLSQTISAIVIAIPCFIIIFKEIGIRFSFFKFKDLISNIKIGFPLVLNYIVDFILAGSDRYLIGLFLSVTSVGYYNPAYILGSLIILFAKAMGGVLPQLLSKAVDDKKEKEAQKMLNYALKFFLLLAIPYIFGAIVFGQPLLTLLANSDVAEKAFIVIPIIAIGTLFYGLNLILANVLFVKMKTKTIFSMNLIASIFNLLANIILLYFFRNIIVAAITTLLSYFIAFIYIYIIIKKDWVVDFQPVVIIKSVLASLFMSCLLFWISIYFDNNNSITILLSQIGMGVVIYLVALLALRTFSPIEMAFLKRFIFR
jgi:O-antigen/teichoic acid export membrane protein